ncbi:unnamed protein product [Mesocestoides corti]|uniref:Uncharacterized protein n=2 Tax=Mesocestoides corti TaxID=53468 RepID=A0A0R3U4L7_MESCO|nr:unnamed protein product [Mesocestoides corti]
MLSSFQEERYNTLDNLKTAFSECLSEWCSLRPLYFAILSIVKNPVVIRAKELDFPPPVEHNIDDIGLMSLSQFIKTSGDLFRSAQASFNRTADAASSSSELSWCSRSLSRLVESNNLSKGKRRVSTQDISQRLDTLIIDLKKLISAEKENLAYTDDLAAEKSSSSQAASGNSRILGRLRSSSIKTGGPISTTGGARPRKCEARHSGTPRILPPLEPIRLIAMREGFRVRPLKNATSSLRATPKQIQRPLICPPIVENQCSTSSVNLPVVKTNKVSSSRAPLMPLRVDTESSAQFNLLSPPKSPVFDSLMEASTSSVSFDYALLNENSIEQDEDEEVVEDEEELESEEEVEVEGEESFGLLSFENMSEPASKLFTSESTGPED